MDKKAFYALSYGVYIISTKDGDRNVGCVANSVMQITSSPATLAVSMNRDNYTHSCIEKTGKFAVNILGEQSSPSLIGKFGFSSSRDTDKYDKVSFEEKEGIPVLHDSCAYAVCRVIDRMETSTHTVFLGEVEDAGVFPHEIAGDPMTYAYYHKVIKGKSPKNAPTYQEEEPASAPASKRWVCSVCGYVYEGEKLPEGYVCPICGVQADYFREQTEQEAPAPGARWVCDVCGYVYEGEKLPDGFTCPLCGMDASHFKKQEAPAPAVEEPVPAGPTQWVCSVCGYVYEGDELPEGYVCPICGVQADYFRKK